MVNGGVGNYNTKTKNKQKIEKKKKINTASQEQLKFKGMSWWYHFYFSDPLVGHQQPQERKSTQRSARGRDLN